MTTKTRSKFIVELSLPDCVSACRKNGKEITGRSQLFSDLKDCTRGGDCEDACRYVLREHNPEFRIVKQIDGKYENVLADHADKAAVCKAIYFESERDFSENETWCDVYLIWQAAHDIVDRD